MATNSVKMEDASKLSEVPHGGAIGGTTTDVAASSETGGDVEESWGKLFLVGPTGLGKKDLAKQVYDKLTPVFPRRTAHVTVGPDRDVNWVFKILLHLLSGQNCDAYEEGQVIEELTKYLVDSSNRYLILINDICDSESWEKIRSVLAHANHGSRAIATYNTTNDSTAKPGPSDDGAYHKELFFTAVLGAQGISGDTGHLNELCKGVDLKKCGGVRLATLALASLLASKQHEKWSSVCNSINFGPEDNPKLENISMSLSYYGLPIHLRRCLMHLSNSKWTQKDSSIWKWVAEGFIGTEEAVGRSLFEVGEEYFGILDGTSLMQREDIYEAGRFLEGCRVNETVLHVIHSSSSREKFVRITNDEHEKVASEGDVSRLAIIGGRAGKIDRIRKMVALKSLCASEYEVDKILDVWSEFEGLNLLELVKCTCRKSNLRLTGIGNLVQLKYLGLAGTPVDELEGEDVENLSCLETLDLRGTGQKMLPAAVGELGTLMCLWADDKTRFPAQLLGKLKSLQDLQLCLCSVTPTPRSSVIEEPKKLLEDLRILTQLRSLRIGLDVKLDLDLEEALATSIGYLGKMTSLEIRSSSTAAAPAVRSNLTCPGLLHCLSLEGICFSKMPACIGSSSSSLTRLAVAVEVLAEDDVELLRTMPQLSCLNLVVATPYRRNQVHQAQEGARIFKKLKFCTTNVLPSALFPAMVSALEVLQFAATVHDILDAPADLGFDLFPSLQQVTVLLNCWGTTPNEQKKAEAALGNVVAPPASIKEKKAKEEKKEEAALAIRHASTDKDKNGEAALANHPTSTPEEEEKKAAVPTIQIIKENQGLKVLRTVQLPEQLTKENPLLVPELVKMRANQQVSRRLLLEKDLEQLDAHLKKLESKVREQPKIST